MGLIASFSSSVVGHTVVAVQSALVLAHQGGWDEMLMVIVPVSAFAAMLYGANRRANRLAEHPAGAPDATTEPDDGQPRNERGGPI